MARIRTIKPEFPQSESMGRVSRDARLTFIMLWTIADDSGRLRGNSRMLASLLFPYDDDAKKGIDSWLSELESETCIVRYRVEDDSYVEILNWQKHQKIDKPSKSKIEPFDESSRILANPREVSSEDQGSKDQGSRTKGPGSSPTGSRGMKPKKPKGRDFGIAALGISDEVMAQAERVWSGWPKDGWNFSTKASAPRRINRALFLERFQEILTHSPIRKGDDSRITAEDLANAALEFVRVRVAEGRRDGSEIPNVPCVANFFSSCENEKNPWKDALLAYFGG